MALTTQTMTDEQRKSVAIEYLKAFDNGGVTSTGGSISDLFADDAQVYFPKWGLANGKEQIGTLFGDVGATLKGITHHFSQFNWVFSGSRARSWPRAPAMASIEDGRWRAGVPESGAGRRCDVFEIRATGRSSVCSSISTRTTRVRTSPVTRGWPADHTPPVTERLVRTRGVPKHSD